MKESINFLVIESYYMSYTNKKIGWNNNMSTDLEKKGLFCASPRSNYIPRSRVNEILDQATRCKLVYVIAGAGYGKTQAVRHYVEQKQDSIIRWIQLSDSDNISSRYWENYTHVVSIDNPDLGAKLREFGFPETPARVKQFAKIIKSLEHRSRQIIFVFDDYHLINSKEVLLFAERCAHLQLPNGIVIVISRNQPNINIVSLQSKGNMSVITEDDLRFTEAETLVFFRQQATPLSPQNLSQLLSVTTGWAIAINMLSVILKKTPLKRGLEIMIKNILMLFENEAWNNFDEPVQKTIVGLSLLSDLPSMPLSEILDDTDVLYITPELTSFIWINSSADELKIHPLYLEFLQSKQHILSLEQKQEIYKRAANWCAENDFYTGAMFYYAKSGQFENMVKLFLSYPFKLPKDVSEYFLSILDELRLSDEDKNNPHVLLLINYCIPLLLVGAGRYNEAKEQSLAIVREWQKVDTPFSITLLYAAYSNLAYIDMYICTLTHEYNAPEYTRKSVEYLKRSTIPPAAITGKFVNADIRSFACLVGEGADLSKFDENIAAARQVALCIEETPYSIYAGYDDLVACEIAYFRNEPSLAANHAHSAILKARDKNQFSIAAMAEHYLLRIAMQLGDTSLAKKQLKQIRSHLDNLDFWNRQLYYDLYTGLFYAKISLPDMVPQWLIMDEKEAVSEIRIPVRELVVNALYYISAKKYNHALATLLHAYPREPHERFLFGELKLLLLTAVARIHIGDTVGAMVDFERAYQLSFCGVFEMFFVELGKELHPLVAAALKQINYGIPEEWLNVVDRKASIYAKKAAVIANAFRNKSKSDEIIPLSDRELEVLIDLYHGLSREEIALNQHISINTVKTRLQSIYNKLNAQNSIDAVRIALEKKLIK